MGAFVLGRGTLRVPADKTVVRPGHAVIVLEEWLYADTRSVPTNTGKTAATLTPKKPFQPALILKPDFP